jgi:hypothetical protein
LGFDLQRDAHFFFVMLGTKSTKAPKDSSAR